MGKKVVPTTQPGAPIKNSAIVHLRGTSGSGKTTAMRALFDTLENFKPVDMNANMTKNTVYRGDLKLRSGVYRPVYVLGDYSPERSAGGCDTIPTIQEVIDLVEKYASRRGSLVVMEGLLLAHSWGALGEYVHPRWGKRYVNVFLDTPVEVCIKRVTKRRADKGRETEGDRAAKIEKNIRDDYYRVELCHKRVINRGGVLIDINHLSAKEDFCEVVLDTASRYCQ